MKKVTDKYELRDMILNGEDISNIDYSEITDMSWMFEGCTNLKKIPHLDTSKVIDMSWMFEGCTNLEYLECPEDFNSKYFSKEQNPLIYKNYLEMFL